MARASICWLGLAGLLGGCDVPEPLQWQALRLYLKGVPFHHKPPFVPGRGSVRQ